MIKVGVIEDMTFEQRLEEGKGVSHRRGNCYFPFFWVIACLADVMLYFIVALICICLMTDDVEHLYIYLLAICRSLEKFLFKSLAQFLIGFEVVVIEL